MRKSRPSLVTPQCCLHLVCNRVWPQDDHVLGQQLIARLGSLGDVKQEIEADGEEPETWQEGEEQFEYVKEEHWCEEDQEYDQGYEEEEEEHLVPAAGEYRKDDKYAQEWKENEEESWGGGGTAWRSVQTAQKWSAADSWNWRGKGGRSYGCDGRNRSFYAQSYHAYSAKGKTKTKAKQNHLAPWAFRSHRAGIAGNAGKGDHWGGRYTLDGYKDPHGNDWQ